MKIIKSSKQNNKTYKTTCPYCKCEFEYEKSDTLFDQGYVFVACPECGENLEADDSLWGVTADNVSFPECFYNFNNGIDVLNDDINNYIKKCINHLKNEDDGEFCFMGTGNTIVEVFKQEDGYTVHVCKGYYETIVNK